MNSFLLLCFSIVTVTIQDDCATVNILPGDYNGDVKSNPSSGQPYLLSKENTEGITILNGCKNEAGENTGANPVVSVLEGEYKNKFKLTSNPKVQGTTLTLSDDYDIISSMEIQLTLQFCSPDVITNCPQTVQSSIQYQINEHAPVFNGIAGEGTIEDVEQCQGDNSEECKVQFDVEFKAEDGDGDVVKYELYPPNPSWRILDDTDLSTLYYTGTGISQTTTAEILVKASDYRWPKDSKSNVALIRITAGSSAMTEPTTTTEGVTEPQDDDGKEKLYFALMITFAVLLGLVLLALLLTPIIIKLCRKDNVFGLTGALSKKSHLKNSGVLTSGPGVKSLYRSFSEMNYDTLEEKQSNASSSPDLAAKITPSGRIKAKTSNPRTLTVTVEDPYYSKADP